MTYHSKIKNNQGFTLLEIMITVAIVAIIAAIAIPSYMDYTKKAHYSELVRATAPYKLGVVECYNIHGNFSSCTSGTSTIYGIPPSITTPPNSHSAIRKITVSSGVITAIPNSSSGLTSDEIYVLTPTASHGMVSWIASGKGVEDGLAK
jgi:type IV pilus assembly protein PilA